MKKQAYLFLFALTALFTSCKDEYKDLQDGLYAEIETSKGIVIASLEYTKTPVTVANFVLLAEGKNTFTSKELQGKPFYDGLKFHRVISKLNGDSEDFMIQGGDPLGNGSGDAGYKFKDEITDLRFDNSGLLAMANSGPATNSSQFFITLKDTPWLDGKHTIFGHVVDKGMDVVNKVVVNDLIISIKIIRKGEAAKKFDAAKIFSDYFKIESENQKKRLALEAESKKAYIAKYKPIIDEKIKSWNALKSSITKTSSGLEYIIIKKGTTNKPEKNATVSLKYAGFLQDGTLIDTSEESIAKTFGKFDEQRAIQHGYSDLVFQLGTNRIFPGLIEGIDLLHYGDKAVLFVPSKLGYGAQGAGNVIPPNADIIFEIELLNKK